MDKTDKNKALLGTIRSTASGPHQPKIGHLLKPLPNGASIIVFCTSCANYIAIKSTAEEVEKEFDVKFPKQALMKKFFLQSPTCPYCNGTPGETKVELKQISDLTKATHNE